MLDWIMHLASDWMMGLVVIFTVMMVCASAVGLWQRVSTSRWSSAEEPVPPLRQAA